MAYLLIDGNSLLHSAQHTTPLSCDGQPTQAIFGFLRTLKSVVEQTWEDFPHILVLWDKPSRYRYALYPEYKANRDDTEEKRQARAEVKAQRVPVIRALKLLGVSQVVADGFEADDLAGFFVRRAKSNGADVRLVTGDRDWLQLVRPGVTWWDPRMGGKKRCSVLNFEEFSGYSTPEGFLDGKALQGDNSDNVKGIPKIGETTAAALIAEFGSVKTLFECAPIKKESLPKNLSRAFKSIEFLCSSEGQEIYERNHALMNLLSPQYDEEIASKIIQTKGAASFDKFLELCMNLQFNSIVQARADWKTAFGANKL